MKNKLRNFACLLSAVAGIFLIASCNSDVNYAESQPVRGDGWNLSDTLFFSPEVRSTGETRDLYLWVRHTKDYKYSNIWLKVITEIDIDDADGMVEVRLADKSGKWLGTCSQSMCTAEVLLKKDFTADEDSAVKLAVLQYMREATLTGVRNVGVEVRTSSEIVIKSE